MLRNLGYWLLRRGLKYSAPVLNIPAKSMIRKYSGDKETFQPVFIVGPPRSGSTILYQLITNYLDVLYIDNLMNMSKEAPWFGAWLSNKIYGNAPHNSFESHHGKTLKSGLHAPNEGLFWYKWLPKDSHYVGEGQIDKSDIDEIKDFVYAIMNRYRKPIVFKNLSFSMRLEFIKEAFPKAKIIYIRRDPVYVAQSIYIARKKEKVKKNEIWSIRPVEEEKLKKMPEVKHIVTQVYLIEKKITKDLQQLIPQQWTVVEYENMHQSKKLISFLSGFIPCKKINNKKMYVVRTSNKRKIDDTVFRIIAEETKRLDWNNFTTKV